jgi:arylsulfatase A-like enzyme
MSWRRSLTMSVAGLALLAAIALMEARPVTVAAPAQRPARPNVLFIAVDDLNHWVRHLGRNTQVITPSIDRLASRGVSFANAYSAAPACNPSRAALMSGLRPSTTGVYHNRTDWRPVIARQKTLITHFRRNGYYTAGAGKMYHGGFDREDEWDDHGKERREPCKLLNDTDGVGGIKFSPLDCGDEGVSDTSIADYAIAQLRREHDKPFLLTIGFEKPHMPWNVPKKYFDMYALDKIELPPYREDDLRDIPPAGVAMARGNESRSRPSDHESMLRSGRWKEAVRAYMAAITYVDGQVGRVLDALDKSRYRDNTIIVLWGDHGWSLGEKHHWRKFALWEEPTRAPLIWVAPGVTRAGTSSNRTVDFMSVYPTLSELCGLPIPAHVEGASIKKLLADPAAAWERPALTTHGYRNHAVRSERWRYIRYADGGEELYDETHDPYEWTNLASDTTYDEVKAELAKAFPKRNEPEAEARTPKRRGSRADEPPRPRKRSRSTEVEGSSPVSRAPSSSRTRAASPGS